MNPLNTLALPWNLWQKSTLEEFILTGNEPNLLQCIPGFNTSSTGSLQLVSRGLVSHTPEAPPNNSQRYKVKLLFQVHKTHVGKTPKHFKESCLGCKDGPVSQPQWKPHWFFFIRGESCYPTDMLPLSIQSLNERKCDQSLGAVPPKSLLTTSVTSALDIGEKDKKSPDSAGTLQEMLKVLRQSSKYSAHQPTISQIKVSRTPFPP